MQYNEETKSLNDLNPPENIKLQILNTLILNFMSISFSFSFYFNLLLYGVLLLIFYLVICKITFKIRIFMMIKFNNW